MFLRLTTLLCAGLYGSMVIFGTEQPGTVAAETSATGESVRVSARGTVSPATDPLIVPASFTAAPKATPETALPVEDVTPVKASFTTASHKVSPEEKPSGLLRIGTFDAPAHVLQENGIDVVEVTGSVVNLRAGPSTADNVVTRMRQGTRAELIDVADNGWMRVRDLDSGAEGFMSGDFLRRVTPG